MARNTIENDNDKIKQFAMIKFMYQIGRYNTLTAFLQMYDNLSKEQKEKLQDKIQKTDTGNLAVIRLKNEEQWVKTPRGQFKFVDIDEEEAKKQNYYLHFYHDNYAIVHNSEKQEAIAVRKNKLPWED